MSCPLHSQALAWSLLVNCFPVLDGQLEVLREIHTHVHLLWLSALGRPCLLQRLQGGSAADLAINVAMQDGLSSPAQCWLAWLVIWCDRQSYLSPPVVTARAAWLLQKHSD